MFSLIIPVYKNEQSLPDLLGELRRLASMLSSSLEVVFVVDGSPDRCFELLQASLPAQPFSSRLVLHSRNFGSFAAIRTGLAKATGRSMAVMAADLQEPVELTRDALESLARDEADITIAVRTGRADPLATRAASELFWWGYRRLVMPEVPPGGVDVFGCSAQVRDELTRLEELNSSLIGLLFWVGFRRKLIPYTRAERRHGASAWTFSRKVKYLLDSAYSFSDLPIRLLKWMGGGALLTALGVGTVVLAARAMGQIEVLGYTPIVLTIMFFGGLNALGIGIVGEYVWRTFENTKRRPVAIVARDASFQAASP